MHALRRGEARLAEGGPLVVDTGLHTGRSPNDKYIVREPIRVAHLVERRQCGHRGGGVRGSAREAGGISRRARRHVVDAFAGADPAHKARGTRRNGQLRGTALFAKTLLIEPDAWEPDTYDPHALVLHAPEVDADPKEDGPRSPTFVVLHPTRREVLIGGTFYAGEIKKSVFTLMNDRLPLEGVLPMHCSANVGDDGDVAVFFGLSGTGKTTLSADPSRHLIGDDEHGWSDTGVFNIEGGCYAKGDPAVGRGRAAEVYATTRSWGTVLENVVVDAEGVLDLDDDSKTENTRAAYKLEQIRNALADKRAGPSVLGGVPHGRRVRDPPADRATVPRPGALLLPLRLHGEARRHGDRRAGASAHVLRLLRRAVPAAAAGHVRAHARRAARPARLPRVARQHRLDGQAVQRGEADADRGDAGDARGRARGCARGRRVPRGSRLRVRRPRRHPGVEADARPAVDGATGRVRPEGARSSPTCSAGTSVGSTSPRRCSPPGRARNARLPCSPAAVRGNAWARAVLRRQAGPEVREQATGGAVVRGWDEPESAGRKTLAPAWVS